MRPPLSRTCLLPRSDPRAADPPPLVSAATTPTTALCFLALRPGGIAPRLVSVGLGGGAPHSSRTGPSSRFGGRHRRVVLGAGSRDTNRRDAGCTPVGNVGGGRGPGAANIRRRRRRSSRRSATPRRVHRRGARATREATPPRGFVAIRTRDDPSDRPPIDRRRRDRARSGFGTLRPSRGCARRVV